MEDPNDTQSEKKDSRRVSGATRRILVRQTISQDAPKAIGRRLSTPPPPGQERSSATPRAYAVNYAAQASQNSGRSNRKLMIGAGIATVLFIVPVIAFVVYSARRPSDKPIQSGAPTAGGTVPVAVATQYPSPEQSTEPTPVESPAVQEDPSIAINEAEVRLLTLQLASQISQKSGYEFGPEFVQLIRERTPEYTSEKPLIAARQYRHEINKSFRDEGLNPLIGYVLALSRSRFEPAASGKGIGIWQLPMGVARSQGYLDSGDNAAKLKAPDSSAQIVASYTRQLLSTFEPDDFMYAISCFGMDLQQAGQLQARLVATSPDGRNRRDIMKMIRAGVLTNEQVETIARFFAAGIVGENPRQFGLSSPQPFSSLY
jgi:hypothetical protein